MTSAQFYYAKDTARGTESIVVSGTVVKTFAASHPNFLRIRDYCFEQDRNGQDIDMDHVLSLSDAAEYINDQLLRISDRVSFKGGVLLWDGEPAEGALADHIVRMIKNRDDNYLPFALFLENLAQNPSDASRAALFEWIADRDFTITEDGHFIGYKGVDNSYKSLHAGYGIVNGVEFERDNLDNTPGNVVEVPRSKVDPDRYSTCSYGLHVGTSSYANSYGTRRVIVSVNPRDVVMVPNDANGQKMRVCRYVVLDDNDDTALNVSLYKGAHREESVEDDGDIRTCLECDCVLPANGVCTCASCVYEDGEDDLTYSCIECGTEVGVDEETCGECEPECDCEFCDGPCRDEAEQDGEDQQLRASLARGLADSAAGRVHEAGDFSQYADDQDADDDEIPAWEKELLAVHDRPTPHGVCQFDGYALDAEGQCTKFQE